LRIGVDATCWQNTRGYGRHARALLKALVRGDDQNQFTFFMDSLDRVEDLPAGVELKTIHTDSSTVVAASANGHRSARDMWRMSCALSEAQVDVLLFPTIYSYVPVLSRAKKIVMIHDVIAEKYPDLAMPGRRSQLFWKTKVALGRWQADAVGTVSDYSRKGIVEHFGIQPDRVHVVGEASDPVFRVLAEPRLTSHLRSIGLKDNERTIVYVGGFSPHKNLEALVKAFAKLLSREFSDVRLVLVGEHQKEVFHSYADTIKSLVTQLGVEDRVTFTGYLPDDEVVVLLNLATVSVLPSLIEGFGLPAVEAAACGCPVIATIESPLPALLGEGGIYFNPHKHNELEAALMKVLQSASLRHKLSSAGREAASKLTWEAAAQQMSNLMRQVATS
jgi:glycosyltransferase involved in cell wall biosynthesis